MDTITGTLTDIRFSKNGFLIGILSSGEAVKGNMSEPVIGQDYRLTGDFEDDPRWGRQFKFSRYAVEAPQDAEGVFRYLVRVAKWVGPIVGRRIIKEFGDEALAILKQDPQRAAAEIKGLTLERAEEISKNLLANEAGEAAAVELETMLGDQHLPKQTITTLVEKHHSDAPARVRQDPYGTLMVIRGIGFPTADRVAISPAIGYAREGSERRIAASLHVLQTAADTQGHTWLPGEKFIEQVVELTGFPPGVDVKVKLVEDEAIRIKDDMIALAKLADDERDVAAFIRQMLVQGDQT